MNLSVLAPIYSRRSLLAAIGLALIALGCESGGVGDPCVPEDEYRTDFSGFSAQEVNVETRSFQCETRVCLVNSFQGRVSCRYGQTEPDLAKEGTDPLRCRIPGTSGERAEDVITVPVQPQLVARRPGDAVYCSCRCDGPDPNATYCECPSGFSCEPLIEELNLGAGQLAGSYCVRNGTQFSEADLGAGSCDPTAPEGDTLDCGNRANGVAYNEGFQP